MNIKEAQEAITEITGQKAKITVDKDRVFCNVANSFFSAQGENLPSMLDALIAKIDLYMQDDEVFNKQKVIVDHLLFKQMIMEELFCNIAATARRELSAYRSMEAARFASDTLSRSEVRRHKRILRIEAETLLNDAAKYDTKKMRFVNASFNSINDDKAVEAKEMCIDYFDECFRLFIENTKEAGVNVNPAILIKRRSGKTWKTIKGDLTE